jgi:tetratricopeptide (TPR) repeat protein
MPAQLRALIDERRLDEAEASLDRLHPGARHRNAQLHAYRGEIAFLRNQDELAEASFHQALAEHAGLPDANYGLSLLAHARGDKEAALRFALFAINGDRTQARYHAHAGLCQLELLNYARAELSLLLATRMAPDYKYAWNNLGIAQRARGNLPGSATSFRRALEIDPEFAAAHANARQLEADIEELGVALKPKAFRVPEELADHPELARARELDHEGKATEAIALCESLLIKDSEEPLVAVELARLYRSSGDPQSGIDVLRAYLTRHPGDGPTTVALAKLLASEHDNKAAEPLLESALEMRPDDPELWHELADIRVDQDRIAEAGPMYERAYELAPTIENKARLAANLIARCRYDDALRLIDELLERAPGMAEEFVGYKVYALTSVGRHAEALPLLDKAVADRPSDPMRRYPRAVIHLLNERYAEGWDDYRYRSLATSRDFRMLPFPEWAGEPLEGKTVVVLAEQGLGDQVMFASCLPDLLALSPKKVWVEAIDRVAPTLARSFPGCEVLATTQGKQMEWVKKVGRADYFVPLGDLPRWFRRSAEAFPAHSGYLCADAGRVEHWRCALAALGPRPKIGISWRGGSEGTRRVLRSLEVPGLRPLFDAIDADWVCLQYGKVEADLMAGQEAGLPMHYWPDSIRDLDEFAALISALDLVVTVCNTTVHYAGALARPTWILAPQVPEWRYGLRTRSLPWYPSTRVFRQDKLGEWAPLLRTVSQELSAWGQP